MVDKLDLYVSAIPEIDAEIYHAMLYDYGEERVHQCFNDYISKMKKEENDLYQCQLKVWKKFGYYLALLEHNPFEEDILKFFEAKSKKKNKKNDVMYDEDIFYIKKQFFSLPQEVFYGFHLLKKQYITIFARENDFITLDVEKIFSSIKSPYACSYVIKQFEYLYDNCTRKSNFDDLFKKFLIEYRKLFVNGKVPDLKQIMDVRDNVEIMDEVDLIEQVKMYVMYSIARDKFVLSNVSLVEYSISKFKSFLNCQKEELFTSGILGILRAIDTFDIRMGKKFSSYGFVGIKNYVYRYYNNTAGNIHLPVYLRDFMFRLRKTEREFYYKYGKKPTTKELSILLKISEEKILERLRFINQVDCDSLDKIICYYNDYGDDIFLMDLIMEPNSEIDKCWQQNDFEQFLLYMKNTLNERELDILFKRNGYSCDQPMTLEEIGNEYGIQRERVRQIEAKAIKKLTKTEYGKSFNPFQ